MKKKCLSFVAALAICLALFVFVTGAFTVNVNADATSSTVMTAIRCDFEETPTGVTVTDGSVANGKLTLNVGGKIETAEQTKFFSIFVGGVKCDKLTVNFGTTQVTLDTATNSVTVTENSVDTVYTVERSIDYSEYSVYVTVSGKTCETAIEDDAYVVREHNGGMKIGVVGKGDALERVYETVATHEMTDFTDGKISVKNDGTENATIDVLKVFPVVTGYDIPTRNYDPADDVVTYTKKPVQYTQKQLNAKSKTTLTIVLITVAAVVVVAAAVIVPIVIKKNRRSKNEN